MKTIFNTYGKVIVVAVAIVALLSTATLTVSGADGEGGVKAALGSVATGFLNETGFESLLTNPDGTPTEAGLKVGNCPEGGSHNLQNGSQWDDETIEFVASLSNLTPEIVREHKDEFEEYICSKCFLFATDEREEYEHIVNNGFDSYLTTPCHCGSVVVGGNCCVACGCYFNPNTKEFDNHICTGTPNCEHTGIKYIELYSDKIAHTRCDACYMYLD